MELKQWLAKTQLVVCVGSGGVGKTTTAAAIALEAALSGRKVMVLTIDPAKRLANALGLDGLGGEGNQIDLSSMGASTGELWAMMLDSTGTFDGIIRRVAPSKEVRDRVLSNVVYRYIADTFAGSQEYMATEKLYDLVSSDDWDLVVLDTPPVKNALDFLESPGRVVRFMEESVMKAFLQFDVKHSGRRLVKGTSAAVWWLLSRIFGQEFLQDLHSFFADFQTMYEGFRARHHAVEQMLKDPNTSFLTVCSPTETSVEVAVYFERELAARGLPAGGVVVNQRHHCLDRQHEAQAVLGEVVDRVGTSASVEVRSSVLARLSMAHRRLHQLAEAEDRQTETVRRAAPAGTFIQEVPRMDQEVHDLASLRMIASALFEKPAHVVPE